MLCLAAATVAWGDVGGQGSPSADEPGAAGRAVVVRAEGMVDHYMARTLRERFGRAEAAGADTVVLQLDTYGGLVDAGLTISRMIKTSDLRVICVVDERAISAGTMIALACDAIYMEDGALLGDCGLIAGNGVGLGEVERAKGESLILEEFADSAERNGYDPLLARAFVVVPETVYAVQGGDGVVIVREVEDGMEPAEGVRSPLDSETTLLTVRASLAETLGLSRGTVGDGQIDEVVAAEGLTVLDVYEPTARDRLVGLLTSYGAKGLLTAAFFFSLFAIFKMPGTGLAEGAAAVSGILLLGVSLLTGVGEWWEVAAVVIGATLLAVEVLLIPGFGVFGASGLVFMLGGLVLVALPPLSLPGESIFALRVDLEQLGRSLATTVGGGAVALVLWAWLARYLPHLPFANKLVLRPGAVGGTADEATAAAPWPAVGLVGVATTDLYPGGQATFEDAAGTHVVDVVSDRGFVDAGQKIVVRSVGGVGGSQITVRGLDKETA